MKKCMLVANGIVSQKGNLALNFTKMENHNITVWVMKMKEQMKHIQNVWNAQDGYLVNSVKKTLRKL